MAPYVLAIAVAWVTTSLVLLRRHRRGLRGPYGSWPAAGWWVSLLFCDGVVAALMLAGASLIAVPAAVDSASGLMRAAAIGVIGPLSLRSPVFEGKMIKGETYDTGFTYLYDYFWRDFHKKLDGAMSSLRMSDRTEMVQELQGNEWNAQSIAGWLCAHVPELVTRSDAEKEDLESRIENAATEGDEEDQLRSLVDIARAEGFGSVLADCRKLKAREVSIRPRSNAEVSD